MPRVTINEIDQSRYIEAGVSAPMVVLVPGTASFGPAFDKKSPAVTTFTGSKDLPRFYATFGYNPATISVTNSGKTYRTTVDGDRSFEYVTNLLANGASVQFFKLNEGTEASATISGEGAAAIKVTAKYEGTFGNYLYVSTTKVTDTNSANTDIVINIYMDSPKLTNMHTENTSVENLDLGKRKLLETFRVSTDPTSIYYANLNAFEYLKDLTDEVVAALIASETTIFALYGGKDFETDVANTELTGILNKLNNATFEESVFANFIDSYLFDFDFVTSGGFVNANTSAYNTEEAIHANMRQLCETRGDCLALLDTPYDLPAYGEANTQSVVSYAKQLNSSFTALYAPWCSIVSVSTNSTVLMPPSFIFMSAILNGMLSSVNNELWYVPAGVNRASAPFVVNPYYEIGSVILNEFQNDHDWRVNPIMKIRNYGYCVYGNSTNYQSVAGTSRSALESMNVRLLANVVKKAIFAVCSALSFEYNDSRLWAKFYAQMDKVLVYMKRNYGLYDYKIIMDSATVDSKAMAERRVPGKIMISPTLAGEFFDIDFEIMPSGVTFSEGGNE